MISSSDLTVGNSVTISVALYKNQWKKFLKLSAIAHLWLLVPIYGWARYLAIAAWISKISLQELNNDLESNSQARYFSLRSLWIFFLVALFSLAVSLILSFLIVCILVYAWFYLEKLSQPIPSFIASVFNWLGQDTIEAILGLTIILLLYLISVWFYVRFIITDLVFAVEKNKKIFTIIKQSYLLTKDSKLKIFKVIGLSWLITVPIWWFCYFLVALFSAFILIALDNIATNLINTNNLYFYLGLYVLICWILVVNVLLMPFWQSLKAIIFYQLTVIDNWDLISSQRQN